MKLPPAFSKNQDSIHAVIETPKGSQNKYSYSHEDDYFRLTKVLPTGTSFPLDFGFIPRTKGEDGDPLDVLVLMDFPGHPGSVVESRVIGIIEAEQKSEKKAAVRNDRILAVASESSCYSHLKEIADIDGHLLDEIIHFFKYYNKMAGRKFRFLKAGSRGAAVKVIRQHLTEEP